MGQSNSRYHEPPPAAAQSTSATTPPAIPNASPDLHPEPAADGGVDTLNNEGSSRSSVRKSILNFVKSSSLRGRASSLRSRANSLASNTGDSKRSWRNSRRWSKAPIDSTLPSIDTMTPSSSTSIAGPSTIDKGKQPERNPPIEDEEEYHEAADVVEEQSSQLPGPTPLPDIVVSEAPSIPEASNVSNPQSTSDIRPENHEGPLPDDSSMDVVPAISRPESPQHDPTPLPELVADEPPPPPTPRPHAAPLPPRQFPPPGTLVVVQGIVHTTDVSRTNSNPPQPESTPSSSASRPASRLEAGGEGTSRARNRLSALLRPRSSSSRPQSTLTTGTPPPEVESPQISSSDSQSSSSEESAQTGLTTPVVDNDPAVVDSQQDQPPPVAVDSAPPQQAESRFPSISSSSIDVLGTLLSVAAAATAASLLTGSSEPILSSGLAPPNAGPSPSPSSPSTTSLPNLHPHHQPQNAAIPDISAAGRAERMRQAWGTIRERLGLRPSVPPPAGAAGTGPEHANGAAAPDSASASALTANANGGDTAAPAAPMDTRELMLAEMARAFNIGLGLNGLGGLTPIPSTGTNEADGEAMGGASVDASGGEGGAGAQQTASGSGVHMPPEGSFERFLVDLQIDLRAALTQVDDEPVAMGAATAPLVPATATEGQQPQGQQEPTHPEASHSHSQPSPQSQPATESQRSALQTSEALVASSSSAPPPPPVISAEPQGLHEVDTHEAEVVDVESDTDSMPFLEDGSDSESEFDGGEQDDEDAEHGPGSIPGLVRHHHHHRPLDAQGRTAAMSGTGHIDASGRINWWRLYRFPPIVSPRTDMAAGLRQAFAAGAAPAPGSTAAATPSPTTPTAAPADASATAPVSTAESTDAAPAENSSSSTEASSPSSIPPPPSSSSTEPQPITAESASAGEGVASTTPNPIPNPNPMPTLASDTPLAHLPPHAVVPVIVVGLQSVNSEWRPEHMPPMQGEGEGIDFFGQPGSGSETGGGAMGGLPGGDYDGDRLDLGWGDHHHHVGEDEAAAAGGGAGGAAEAGRERGRARGWQSRAANAIRNLRPGRRNGADAAGMDGAAGTQTPLLPNAPGSRTFLIYVIGGYYPPDHSIVTGGPNNLDSFEALLELADLLGQVKPPTVSKDEIEKSGLEIIKAAQLVQHEKDGKISSNCLDRCLICLDDYQPEEDIRVMTCRHAFHKACVDEWLQKGRNNCPACRSTGVATDAYTAPVTPAPTA